MQSVSADLANAILSPAGERPQPLCRLRVDWSRNGSYTDTYQALVGGGTGLNVGGGVEASPGLNYNEFGGPSSSGCTNSVVTASGSGYLHDCGGTSASTPAGTNPAVYPGAFTFWLDSDSPLGDYNWLHLRETIRPDLDTQSVAGLFWAIQTFTSLTAGGVHDAMYFGLQSRSSLSGNPKAVNFAIWQAVDAVAGDVAGTVAAPFTGEGDGYQCMAPYTWTAGRTYTFAVTAEPSRGSRWFALYVRDETTQVVTWIGSIRAAAVAADYVRGAAYNFTELFSQVTPATSCTGLPRSTTLFGQPTFSTALATVGSTVTVPLDDLSADVVSVSTSRELSTDLPVAAKLFAGQAAATATVALAHRDPTGDPAKHGAWYYSPLNLASPLAGFERKGAPARLEFGFVTATGPEYVTVLEGFVRSLQVTSGGRVAVLTLEDRSATFRRQVPLPMVVADGTTAAGGLLRPGLRTSWIVSHLARQCGWYPQPPPRSDCKFLATMAGSAHPEIGTMFSIEGSAGEQPGFEPTAENPGVAKWVMGVATSTSGDPEMRYNFAGTGWPSVNNGSTMLVEGWWRFRSTSINQPLWITFTGGGAGRYASVYWKQSTGQLVVTFNRGGGEQNSIVGPTISPGTSSYHYIGIHLSFTSTGVTATFRYDGTTTGPTTTATTSITGQEIMDSIALDHGRVDSFADAENSVFMEAVQLTTEASPGTWNNAFVPTADVHTDTTVDTKLLAIPPSSDEAWTVLQQVAEAEFATTGFDETGRFVYWPRTRWTTPPYTTSQRTLTSTTSLKELEVTEAIDQARNHIVIGATQVEIQVTQIVWRSVVAHPIPAAGRRLYCAFSNPVANLDTSFIYGSTGGQSRYLASTARNGAGTARSNLGMTVTAYANHCFIDVDNPNAETDYLVANSGAVPPGGTQGMPYLILEGQPVLFDQADDMRAEASSGAADLLLELEASPFRQDLDLVEGVAADLLADLADPGPVLSDVPAVGDPRLQLGDRVTIVDAEGLGFTADFHLSKIDFEFSPSEGLSMTLALRAA